MQYETKPSWEDTIRLATPEGVELELELAGIGSRLTARLIDVVIQAALIVASLLVFYAAFDEDSVSGTIAAVLGVVLGFIVFWAYDVLFETFNQGQTPGKRLNGLRVIGVHGEPVSFPMAAVRNLLRLVDEELTLFIAALVSIVRSPRNQRLGDIAAGTLVVRERPTRAAPALTGSSAELDVTLAWDTSAIGDGEMSAVRQFLDRRHQIEPHARAHLANELAAKLRPRVPGAENASGNEAFLETLAAIKARSGA